jgi:hypothetical protein
MLAKYCKKKWELLGDIINLLHLLKAIMIPNIISNPSDRICSKILIPNSWVSLLIAHPSVCVQFTLTLD